jgi:hypothetical protein
MRVTAAQVQGRLMAARRTRVAKATGESRYVLGVAYPAHELDGHDEGMTGPTVEQTAWGYLADGGRQIGLFHADQTVGHATVVESYVYRGPDWELTDASGQTQVVKAGDWLLGAVFDEPAWRLVKAGRVQGWSIDGAGKRRQVPRAALEKTRGGQR